MFAVARGVYGVAGAMVPSLTSQLIIGLLFAVGTLLGVSRVGGRLSTKLFVAGPLTASSADLGSAVAVLGSSLFGSPCRGRVKAQCRPFSRSVSSTRPPNRTCGSRRIRLCADSCRRWG